MEREGELVLDPQEMRKRLEGAEEDLRQDGLSEYSIDADAGVVAMRAELAALALLAEGWTVKRRDYAIVGEWRGFNFVAYGPTGEAEVTARAVVDRDDRGEVSPQSTVSVSWYGENHQQAAWGRAQAVVLLLASLWAQERESASAPGDH